MLLYLFFFQAEDGIRYLIVTGVQTCALPISFPSWGAMLSGSGRTYMFRAPWMAVWPGVAISLAVFGFNMLGDALRDVLDPRLRGGAPRRGLPALRQGRPRRNAVHPLTSAPPPSLDASPYPR